MGENICVITPCFNPGKYLLPCLQSVKLNEQSVSRHILIDGGSTDGTIEVLKAASRSFPNLEWISEKDRGQSDALNKALAKVDTRYFGWLNADDFYLAGSVSSLVEKASQLEKRPAIVYGDYLVVDGESRVLRCRRQPTFVLRDCMYGYLTVQNVAAIFDTELLRESGGFEVNLRFAMDYDIIMKLANIGKVEHVREYVGAFRIHEQSKTSNLQTICEEETSLLRQRHTGSSSSKRKFMAAYSKIRVAARMALEGCIPCRMSAFPSHERERAYWEQRVESQISNRVV